jgi:hypothetical protein
MRVGQSLHVGSCNYTLAKMPLPNTTQSMQQEGRIALAIDAIQKGHFTSTRAAAKSYDILHTKNPAKSYRNTGHWVAKAVRPGPVSYQ